MVPRDGIMDPDGATDSVRLQAASAPEVERRAFMDDRSICMHACSCGMWHVYSSGCGCSFMPMKVHGVACMPKTPRIGLGLMGITPWPANAGIGLSTPRSGQITNTTSIKPGNYHMHGQQPVHPGRRCELGKGATEHHTRGEALSPISVLLSHTACNI